MMLSATRFRHFDNDHVSDSIDLSRALNRLLHLALLKYESEMGPFAIYFQTSHLSASEPRDKIYGSLALMKVPGPTKYTFTADYNKPLAEVYTDFTIWGFLTEPNRLKTSFLSLAGIGHSHTTPSFNLPSWVPDWGNRVGYYYGGRGNASRNYTSREYIGVYEMTKEYEGALTVNTLEAQAMFIEAVSWTTPLVDDTDKRGWWSTIRLLMALDNTGSCTHPLRTALLTVFFRTVLGLARNKHEFTQVMGENMRHAQGFLFKLWLGNGQGQLPHGALDMFAESTESSRRALSSVLALTKAQREAVYWTFVADTLHLRDPEKTGQLFKTGNHYLGYGPRGVASGDILCVLLGFDAPVLIRRYGDKYRYVGPCYVHGMMKGEIIDQYQSGTSNLKIENIKLV
jgi:hypothetical protein